MANREEIVKFSYQIECLAKEHGISYMEAVVHHCEATGLEIELTSKLISSALKAKIQIEAEALHYLPKSNTVKLPL